jgi:hypothetical protein
MTAAMFGERAVELIKELHRDEWIPPYNVRDGVDASERSSSARLEQLAGRRKQR